MMNHSYLIIADRNCPINRPLTGLRGFLAKYLRVPFKPDYVVFRTPGNKLYCNPATVAKLTATLTAKGIAWHMSRPGLQVLATPSSEAKKP